MHIYVCIHIYVYVRMHIYVYMCVCTYVCIYMPYVYVHMHIYVYLCFYMYAYVYVYIRMHIYMSACVCVLVPICIHTNIHVYICIFRQHFFVNANFIEHNRHFMPTYSLLDPFEFPYYFYRIRGELIKVLSKTSLHSSNLLKQKLHHFCNRFSPNDGPKSGRKY